MRSPFLLLIVLACCGLAGSTPPELKAQSPTYGEDRAFLESHVPIVELVDGERRLVVVPAWQGRVMTSTLAGEDGLSQGWINRPVIEQGVLPEAERAGKLQQHIHVFGGEERLWLGPEGGPFSFYFAPGAKQTFANWRVPAVIDTQAWPVVNQSANAVTLRTEAALTHTGGRTFTMTLQRTVRLLTREGLERFLAVPLAPDIELVAYASVNRITNRGDFAWTRETGMPSIWILGMYPPSPRTVAVIPLLEPPGPEAGPTVNTAYFGEPEPDQLAITPFAVYFRGDGRHRAKIGVPWALSTGRAGSYAADTGVLTLVATDKPDEPRPYVNSLWGDQADPFGGDLINAYNDGPPEPGADPLGPFYELETSSPAAELAPGESLNHVQITVHARGPEESLDSMSRMLLHAGLDEIEAGLD
ncbi:MAG: DUF6786 family protein [Opitutales bacterium]